MLLVLHSPVRFLDPTKEDHMRGVQHIVRRRRRQHLDRSVLMMAVAFLLCYMFLLALSILPIASAFVFTSHDFRTSLIIQQHRSPSVGHRVPPLAQLSARGATTITRKSTGWYPKTITYDDDIFSEEDATAELEERVIQLAANLVRHRLFDKSQSADKTKPKPKILSDASVKEKTIDLVKGRFMDLTCTQAGEEALERLFWEQEDPLADLWVAAKETAAVWTNIDQDDVIRCAAMVIQSLCVLGTQVGVKGQPEQLRRMVEHLANDQNKNDNTHHDFEKWTADSVRRLKFKLDRTPAQQLLAELRWKKTPQSAFDLLVALGAWEKHEDLALLRSGFPIRFTEQEEKAAADAMQKVKDGRENVDPDAILGLRQDLRHLKVYTVDSESTAEIDDGISLEAILANHEGGREERRQRIWIHIADAERWASPHSELFESARRRITSLYLPSGSISMFPSIVGTELMSLQANRDVCALSLGVELNDDGSIIESSLIVTPSLIRVSYRLTYDEVDEMLEEGIGYNEEWELGALLAEATKRREFRILNGSTEGMVPNPVPYAVVSIFSDETAPDSVGISVDVQMSHNAARNKTATAEDGADASTGSVLEEPVSSAYLLVTETMILAGEAIGRWKGIVDAEDKLMPEEPSINENLLRLPFRTQRQPDFKSRSRERLVLMDLLEFNVGKGLCHAWYARRFLESVTVSEMQMPHSGLGLDCYVQWSSPIRRFSDLNVHACVKRYLRRRKVYELLRNGQQIPKEVSAFDLGVSAETIGNDGRFSKDVITSDDLDNDVNYLEGVGLVGAARKVQRQSQQYWLFEYIRRQKEMNPSATYSVVVLGCVDPEKRQYAVYVKELGLEHRYTSPGGRLDPGAELLVKVDIVTPRSGILSFVRVV